MKRVMKFVMKYGIPLTVGFVTTVLAVRTAYEERGYVAVGSEWMVFPFTVLLFKWGKEFLEHVFPLLIEIFKEDEE